MPGTETATFSTVLAEASRSWASTPWKPLDADYRDGVYTGRYRVELASDHTDDAPHRPLVHGSTLYNITE